MCISVINTPSTVSVKFQNAKSFFFDTELTVIRDGIHVYTLLGLYLLQDDFTLTKSLFECVSLRTKPLAHCN